MTAAKSCTPPMGWNSWDCFGTTVTEAEVLANAEFMAEHLLPHGWDTVVVDIDWSDPGARSHGYNQDAQLLIDEHGRLIPDPVRFPCSAGGAGFAPLAEKVHALGLRFGVHVMRGIPKLAVAGRTPILGTDHTADEVADPEHDCEWHPHMVGLHHDHPAAQAYYDSVLRLLAGWGVDFIKADDMLWPYQATDIEAFSTAIGRSGRAIELSLSPGRDLAFPRLQHLQQHATMWRICDDLWDKWEDVEANFARFARWAPHAGPQGWPDGDMLPLGRIGIRAERGEPRHDGLRPAERRTLMTLWVIARSPLMIGGHLPESDPQTVALFTNGDVLDVLKTSSGNRELFREGDLVLWGADGPDGARFAAAFNLGDEARELVLDSQNMGLPAQLPGSLVELWSGEPVAATEVQRPAPEFRGVALGSSAVPVRLDAHGSVLLRYTP